MSIIRRFFAAASVAAMVMSMATARAQQRCPDAPGSVAEWAAVASGEAQVPVKNLPRLAYALGQQRRALLKRLLAQGENPNICVAGISLLTLSALSDDVEEVRLLLEAGARLDSPLDSGGGTPLLAAIGMRRYRTAALLIERGANPNSVNDGGATALHELVVAGDPADTKATEQQVELADMLLRKGHAIDPHNSRGTTPLLIATLAANMPVAQWLVEHGADPNASNAKGDTPLSVARRRHQSDFVELFEHATARSGGGKANARP
jgi:ankyrin repeat protein